VSLASFGPTLVRCVLAASLRANAPLPPPSPSALWHRSSHRQNKGVARIVRTALIQRGWLAVRLYGARYEDAAKSPQHARTLAAVTSERISARD